MKDILKYKNCPISQLQITTKPEWKYIADDGSCTLEIGIIGNNVLYEIPIGIVDGEANAWYIKTANKIIAEYFGNQKYYLAYDYTLMKNASLESKKIFINWIISNSNKIDLVTVFGMNNIIKVALKTARIISKEYEKLLLTNSYEESIHAILLKEKSYGILSHQICPVSRLPITTNSEWKNENDSPFVEIGKIGKNIIFISVVGPALVNSINSCFIILNRIIDDHNSTESLHLVFDYTKLTKESMQVKRLFVKWGLTIINKVKKMIFFGVSNSLKLTINTTKMITSRYDKVIVCDTYQEAILHIEENKNEFLNKENIENAHINELIGYLGKMTWTGNLNQEIPVLPKNDPLAELYAAVAVNQEELREIDKDRNKALEELSAQKAMLQKNEELFRTVADFAYDWEYWESPKHELLYISPSCKRITGYSDSEFMHNPKLLQSIVYQDDIGIMENHKHHSYDNSETESIEFRIITKSGEVRWIGHVCQAVYNKNGVNIGVRSSNREITDRKQVEEKLKASEEKFKYLIDNQGEGFGVVDKNETFVFANPKAEKIFGVESGKLIGKNLYNFFNKEQAEIIKEQTKNRKQNQSNSYELILTDEKEQTKTILVTASPNIDNTGNINGTIGIFRDITDRKKAEDALVEVNKTKDKFFSIIGHDLRSPFNSMMGFAGLLNNEFDEFSTKEKKKFIGIIYNGLQNTLKLLDNLLYWAQSQKGTIAYKPEQLNLLFITKEISELLTQSLENKSIKLINRIPENIYINADKNMIATIIRNLLSNAIKFTNKFGEITINTFLLPNEQQNQFVGISVTDTGVGIPKEKQYSLFDIAENTSTPGTENEKGTGLGLILCKEFVEKHGGEIWVESEVKNLSAGRVGGTTFFFTIPR